MLLKNVHFWQSVMNVTDFWWNNNIFMQKNRVSEKYDPQGKFILRQLEG